MKRGAIRRRPPERFFANATAVGGHHEMLPKETTMRVIASLAFCFLLLSAAVAYAEPTIAVFNVQKVAAECDALKDAKAALEKKFGAQKEALEKQRDTLEKKAAALKGKVTEKQQAELSKMHREYTEKAQAFVRVFQADELRVRRDIDTVISTAAKELAARKGYSFILDSGAAIYFETKFDVTNEMLAETNAVWAKSKTEPAAAKDDKDDKKDDKGADKAPADADKAEADKAEADKAPAQADKPAQSDSADKPDKAEQAGKGGKGAQGAKPGRRSGK